MLERGKPLVSVITVVKNGESHIEQAILSVLNQSYTNIEYLVIDGESTDQTLEIVNSYKDRIAQIISERDSGIANAFNKGIENANGELIGILNADDWYEPNAIEKIINQYYVNYSVYCGNIKLYKNNTYLRNRKSRKKLIKYGMYIMHPTVFVKKTVYENLGKFDESLKIAMDFDFLLRIAQSNNYEIKYINADISNMRIGGASKNIQKMHQEELKVIRKNLNGISFYISFSIHILSRLISAIAHGRYFV